ncbi:MAG: HAMP domain-containing histidine kinase [Planctomycetaceae bacterium]|jgi:signal transduction histidine kinase|nr:HAMP domain-containing histidine kinase [Planctomycetaceae bacterium]
MSGTRSHFAEEIRPHQWKFAGNTVSSPNSIDIDTEKAYIVKALSHDINAQLMILEYSHQICAGIASETRNRRWDEAHEHVTACINGLKRFVSDMVSYAKTGGINMEPEKTSLQDVMEEVLYEQKHILERRSIETVISPALPHVFANRQRVKQILNNLIRNAALHGCDSLKPIITVTAECGVSEVFLNVCDNGVGIPAAVQEKVFEPGYRAPNSSNTEGSGIGLAIVRKIARYYGGDAVLTSDRISGTTFQVRLPMI